MKKPAYRYAVTTADPEFHALMKRTVSEAGNVASIVLNRSEGSAFFEADLSDLLKNAEANILIADVGGGDKEAVLEGLQNLLAQMPDLRVVLIGQAASAADLLQLMRTGVSDYLQKPLEDGALEAALARVTRGIAQHDLVGEKAGRVIGFFGPKGGTGVTTTVANLAILLQEKTVGDVLLADLNAELGTASILLGVRPRYNFVELVKNFHRMDQDLLHSYVTKHESGVAFLPSSLTARDLEGVTRQRIDRTMTLLRSQYDHVVLDLGNSMTPLAQAGLGVCDEVVVVLNPEIPALRNAKRLLPVISQSVVRGQHGLRFLLNRYDGKVDIPLGKIRDTLGHDIAMTVPRADEASAHAANVGRPLVMEGPSKYQKALSRLAADLAMPGSIVKTPGRSGAGALLNRFKRARAGKSRNGTAPTPPTAPEAPEAPESVATTNGAGSEDA